MKITNVVEISDQTVKIVAVKQQANNLCVDDYCAESILSLSDERISESIAQSLKKNKFKSRSAVICLPRNIITVRNLHLPSHEDSEIAQMLDLHISRIVPYKKEETIFAYQLLGVDEMGYSKLVLAIVQINALRRCVRIAERSGLCVERISLSSYGAWQHLLSCCRPELDSADIYLFLDIDTTFSDFIVFTQENMLFSRSINIGANDIRSNQQANLLKLLGEVKQSLIIFGNEERNKRPVKVFVGGAQIADGLLKTIEDELGMPVRGVPCAISKDLERAKGKPLPTGFSFSGLVHLSAFDNAKIINFVLPELQIDKSLKEKTRELFVLGSLAVYIFCVICTIFITRISSQQNYLKKINKRALAIEKDMGELVGQLGRIEFIKEYMRFRRLPLLLVYQLQGILPGEIFINYMDFNEGKVTLRGQALQLSDVFKFVTTIEQSKSFKELQTKYTRKKKIRDVEVTEFELSFLLTG